MKTILMLLSLLPIACSAESSPPVEQTAPDVATCAEANQLCEQAFGPGTGAAWCTTGDGEPAYTPGAWCLVAKPAPELVDRGIVFQ